jgi:hypothetical protein
VDPLSGIRDDNGTQIVMDIGGMLDVDSCEFGRIHGVFHDADTVAHKGEILRLRTMDVADRRLGGGVDFAVVDFAVVNFAVVVTITVVRGYLCGRDRSV